MIAVVVGYIVGALDASATTIAVDHITRGSWGLGRGGRHHLVKENTVVIAACGKGNGTRANDEKGDTRIKALRGLEGFGIKAESTTRCSRCPIMGELNADGICRGQRRAGVGGGHVGGRWLAGGMECQWGLAGLVGGNMHVGIPRGVGIEIVSVGEGGNAAIIKIADGGVGCHRAGLGFSNVLHGGVGMQQVVGLGHHAVMVIMAQHGHSG